jgi:hypothetical protein
MGKNRGPLAFGEKWRNSKMAKWPNEEIKYSPSKAAWRLGGTTLSPCGVGLQQLDSFPLQQATRHAEHGATKRPKTKTSSPFIRQLRCHLPPLVQEKEHSWLPDGSLLMPQSQKDNRPPFGRPAVILFLSQRGVI